LRCPSHSHYLLLPPNKAGIFSLRAASHFHSAPKADRQLQKRARQNEETSKLKQGSDDKDRGELTGDRTRFLELMITLGARRLHEIQRQSPGPAPPSSSCTRRKEAEQSRRARDPRRGRRRRPGGTGIWEGEGKAWTARLPRVFNRALCFSVRRKVHIFVTV
jgi:hypothetical protein